MANNYSRQTYDRYPETIQRMHLCPLCGDYVMPLLGKLGDEHKGHCQKDGIVTYASMPETVVHEFTAYFKAERAAEQHKAMQIVLDVANAGKAKVARFMDDMSDYLDLKATEANARY